MGSPGPGRPPTGATTPGTVPDGPSHEDVPAPPQDDPGPAAGDPVAKTPRKGWKRIPAPLRHGLTLLIAILLIEYLVVPKLEQAHLQQLERIGIGWLIAGVALEGGSLLCYAFLTRVLLPPDGQGVFTLFRVGLAGAAVAHVVPGGTAASAGLGYKLLTGLGVDPAAVGFAMASQGMGSAVVLNALLWLSLIISIPLAGFHPIYLLVAVVGLIVLLLAAVLVYAFTRGEEVAIRVVRRVGDRLPRVGADRMERLVRQLATSVRAFTRDRRLMRQALLWAALNWLLDAASLWCFVAALGHFTNPAELFAAYGIANVLAALPITPGGLGLVDGLLPILLASSGASKSVATLGVIGWRLVNFWLPIPLGAASYLSLRVPRGAGTSARRRVLHEMVGDDDRSAGAPPEPPARASPGL
ncbi:MAG: hypothetical protein JWM85_590 [Acidimicrobiaceae bacterium]|nr:hypothetical protein [Acidimicrobiaceae bacterium]